MCPRVFSVSSHRIIIDADWESITGKVAMKGAEMEVPLGEQTISQALKIARDQFLTLAN
jgi:hypothetical protein